MLIYCVLLFAASPVIEPSTTSCDIIELNHTYDNKGTLVFSQYIYWDWSHKDARFNVRGWQLIKNHIGYPVYKNHYYHQSMIKLNDHSVMLYIVAPEFKVSHTQYDPEVRDREILPRELRKGIYPGVYNQ